MSMCLSVCVLLTHQCVSDCVGVDVDAGVVCVCMDVCVKCVAAHKHALHQEMRRRAIWAWPLSMCLPWQGSEITIMKVDGHVLDMWRICAYIG